MPAANMRFGAMAAEARNNGSANLKEPCAAERLLEAATAPSRFLVVCKRESAKNLNGKSIERCKTRTRKRQPD